MGIETALAVGAVGSFVAGAGSTIYGMTRGGPKTGAPPLPASYYQYDEDGNLVASQTWDSGKNAYVYRPAPLTEAQKQEKAQRQGLRTQMLSNLGATPLDRVRAYTDYAKAISESLHRDVDYQHEKNVRATDENMAARGLLGSRAYVDAQAELTRSKTLADTDIANKAELGKENLMNQDRQFWLNTLGSLDSERNASGALASQNWRNIMAGSDMATRDLMAGYNTDADRRMNEWATNLALNRDASRSLMDTASGLAFLYGYKTGGAGNLAAGKSGDFQRGGFQPSFLR